MPPPGDSVATTNSTDGTEISGVSPWYFRLSAAVWFTTPLLFMGVMLSYGAFPYMTRRTCHPALHYPFRVAIQ